MHPWYAMVRLTFLDDTRAWGPPYAKYTDNQEGPGESAYYLGVSLTAILQLF
jgi:hypothetical protein